MTVRKKQPWPTKAVMDQIYEQHLWGGQAYDFYSGEGSHHPDIVNPYLDVVTAFLKSHNNSLNVCDFGCGDFNIGQHLFQYTKNYIAIDIVEALIERNKRKFNFDHLQFLCLDIAKDELPVADCAIIRQVFQHLSNAEILQITEKLYQYKYLILTEHIPSEAFIPNLDIISGQGIRLKHQSGVDLLEPPFNLKVKCVEVLNEIDWFDHQSKIVTKLYSL